ncbi:MAG: cytochrome P450 [Dehalococcoidia bacterium]
MVAVFEDDLFTPDFLKDPYTYFQRLREEDPVHWNEKYEVWIITRYEELVWVARHNELFSSEVFKRDPRGPYPEIDEDDLELYKFVRSYQSQRFIQHDRPEHAQERMVVHSWFNPKAMEQWRPMVQSAIKELLDRVEEKGGMDVMRDFAVPLPLLVISQMMEIPTSDRPYVRSLAEKTLYLNRGEADRLRIWTEGVKGLWEYLVPLVDERVGNPEEDLLSVLAGGARKGVFTRDEVVNNAILLLVAGHETTINLICNGTLAFIHHPEQWELLRANPTMSFPPLIQRATEECLRYDSSVKSIQRIAAQDVEMRGKVIRKDDRVRWFISSANRDAEAFERPDEFDITRWPNRHVSFGSGVHHCLGATLARLEGQEAFQGLAQRFPSLHLETEDLEYQPSMNFRSLKALPVTWN